MAAAFALQPPLAAADFSGAPTQQAAPAIAAAQVIAFSKKVERELAARGARVAIVARAGRPASEMPPGMRYTHAGFAVYSEILTADGRRVAGYAMYNDYQSDDEPDTSSLVQDYPVDFYAAVKKLEAGLIIPSPELQRRLLELIDTPAYRSLHERPYSAIANPYTLGKQNCTEFVLDVVQAAIYRTSDIRVLKAHTRAYFAAQPVLVGPFKLVLGSLFSREISLSDQPQMPPVTATFETIARYLQQYDQGSVVFEVLPD
ncbi:MAG: DUF2145 domain-containing protein [Burkholderiales bacterium]|nr:DUF2145 domain-containing protein [Burkholderiales bacterium]